MFSQRVASTGRLFRFSRSRRTIRRRVHSLFEEHRVPESAFGIGLSIGISVGCAIGFFALPEIAKMINDKNEYLHSSLKKDDDDDDGNENGVAIKRTVDPLTKFLEFASVEKGNERYMTIESFANSLFAPKTVKNISELNMLISLADTNNDGLISYAEYCLFLSLMGCDEQDFRIAFNMFDTDGNGVIDKKEFIALLKANHIKSNPSDKEFENNHIITHFFKGEDKMLSFNELYGFIKGLKEELLAQEFKLYEESGQNFISIDQFIQLATHSMRFANLNQDQLQNHLERIRKRGFFKGSDNRIDYETFKAFHLLSRNLENISMSLRLYASQGNPVDKPAFKRALHRVAGVQCSDRTADILFSLFDINGDDQLEFDEFIEVLRARNAKHVLIKL